MAAQGSFWQRVSSFFRSDLGQGLRAGGDGRVGAPEPPAGLVGVAGPHSEPALAARGVAWWRRHQARRAQARQAVLRVGELAEALEQHFRQQDQRAAELAASLDRVASVLGQLAHTQQVQGECLQSIARHSELAERHAAQLSETLSRVPESLLTQAEAIRTVAAQLDLAQQSDRQLVQTLEQFARAADALGSSGTAQVNALQNLATAQREQQLALSRLVREQSRRLLVMGLVTAIVALGALGALVVSLIRELAT